VGGQSLTSRGSVIDEIEGGRNIPAGCSFELTEGELVSSYYNNHVYEMGADFLKN
jgi:hypothetical protein